MSTNCSRSQSLLTELFNHNMLYYTELRVTFIHFYTFLYYRYIASFLCVCATRADFIISRYATLSCPVCSASNFNKEKKLIYNYSQGPCITIPLWCVSGGWVGVKGTRQTWTDVRCMYYCLATQLSAASY